MTPARCDQQAVTRLEGAGLGFIGKAQQRLALKQHHPFAVDLVVPKAWGTGELAGMNQLEPQLARRHQEVAALLARRGTGTQEQVGSGPMAVVLDLAPTGAGVLGIGILGRLDLGLNRSGGRIGAGRPGPSRGQLWRSGGAGGLSPASGDVKATTAGQVHHLLVAGAIAQPLAEGRIGLTQGDKGIELAHLLEKLLQLGFSHQGKGTRDLVMR